MFINLGDQLCSWSFFYSYTFFNANDTSGMSQGWETESRRIIRLKGVSTDDVCEKGVQQAAEVESS